MKTLILLLLSVGLLSSCGKPAPCLNEVHERWHLIYKSYQGNAPGLFDFKNNVVVLPPLPTNNYPVGAFKTNIFFTDNSICESVVVLDVPGSTFSILGGTLVKLGPNGEDCSTFTAIYTYKVNGCSERLELTDAQGTIILGQLD